LRPVSWERALEVASGLKRHRGHVAALVGGQATNEEGFLLQRLLREGLESHDIDCRGGERIELGVARALADPGRQAKVSDLEFAHTILVLGCEPLDEAPILDLRIRKGVRRRGVNLTVATARPSALDVNASIALRYPPGGEVAFVAALNSALSGERAEGETAELATLLRGSGEDVVIVWSERLPTAALPHLLVLADHLKIVDHAGAGLLEVPVGANGRGLREAGVLPNGGPGYAKLDRSGRGSADIAHAVAKGDVHALYLFGVDPVRELPDRASWERALHAAGLVVAHASVLTDGLREHANVIFPAESHAEKEGTVVHPDGRIQRLRSAIAHPGEIRAGWSVIAEIAKRAGLDLGVLTSGMAFRQLVEAVPFYAELTLEEIGGRGVRWPERDQAATLSGAAAPSPAHAEAPESPRESSNGDGVLRLGTYRSLWAAPEVELSPALHYAVAEQRVELSPEDARRLGIAEGDRVLVSQSSTRLHGEARVRSGVQPGTAFLAEGIAVDSANALTEPLAEVRKG
jgi:NADH-quinone oxidoreductase subunit G